MNQDFFDPEIFADFVLEAREHLETIEPLLLELEKEPENLDVLNEIFRPMHSLKGASGFLGLNTMNGLAHKAENILDELRKGNIRVTPEIMDVILNATDSLNSMVANLESDGNEGEVATTEIIARIEALLNGGSDAPAEKRETTAEAPQEQADALAGEDTAAQEGANSSVDEGEEPLEPVDQESLAIFDETVGQQFENISMALTGLREDASRKDLIDGLYRSLVTVQNSAGYMGLEEIGKHAERTAGLVDQGRSTDLDFSMMTDILEQEVAILQEMVGTKIEALQKASGGSPPSTSPTGTEGQKQEDTVAPAPEAALPEQKKEGGNGCGKNEQPKGAGKAASTIRVDHGKLDHLMNLIGELIINRNRFSLLARALEGEDKLQDIAQQLTETTYSMARISDDLQDTIMKVRMVPVKSVFSRFPRLVRDLSRKSGKKVELITEGEETELDKSVVEEIGDPLVHLIRNAVDHGLEDEAARTAAGKDPVGRVWLKASHKGNSVVIEVEDDGRGIDPGTMRRKAVEKGLMTEEDVRSLDDQQAVELIFAPGFSTADQITDISGRGVGMDVVRNNIKNLNGGISVQSVPGKGSRFILSLPLTLAIIDALMVEIGGETFAIPLDAVSETTKIESKRFTEVNQRKAVTLRGKVLGIVELGEILGLESASNDRDLVPIVIISVNERRLGLVVDKLLERQEIVIKSLGEYLGDLHGISGATIMGDGGVVLILDPNEVYMRAISKAAV